MHPCSQVGDTFAFDWITVAKAPTIFRVEGCTRKKSDPQRVLVPKSGRLGLRWDMNHIQCLRVNGNSRWVCRRSYTSYSN